VTGPRPLVLFLHGRHSYCYDPLTGDDGWKWPCRGRFEEIPSQLGYDYIQQVLASQGFTTVSVRVNGINAQDYALNDGGAAARAFIVRRHLDHWVGLATAHQVDLSQVVLVGHSRGGEGVDRASLQIPLSAPYRIAGQVLLAPTNFGTQTAAYIPTVTVLPYCDGDVIDLQGQRFTDSARDLARDDTSLKSSVLVMGANHNFFNTEWTPGVAAAPSWDDWWGDPNAECGVATATRLTDAEQRSVGVAYVAGAAQLFTRDAQQFLPLYDGSRVSVASTGDADVRSAAIGGGRTLRRPGKATGLTLADGAATQFCSGVVEYGGPSTVCGRGRRLSTIQTPHWPDSGELVPTRREFEMSWTAAGQSGGLVFDTPIDLTGRRLEMRTIVDPTRGDAALRVRLTDAEGASAVLDPVGGDTLPALPLGDGLGKRWAQALVVDPSAVTGIDLARVASVDLVAQSARGRVWVLDVASAPATLAAVPAKRLPLVSLGTLRVLEGDGPGMVTARVPFTVTGDLTGRGSLTVGVVSYDPRSRPHRLFIDLAPGQTSGSIPLTYQADKLDDFSRVSTLLFAWARRGVMTDRYDGKLVVIDDDPAPKISVSPLRRTVSEGQNARWRAKLSSPAGYGTGLGAQIVKGRTGAQPLRAGDVPRSWLKQQLGRVPSASTPLFKLPLYLYFEIRAGRTSTDLVIPIRRDRVRERRESLTLSIELRRRTVTQTVYVAP
jgi:dienelactone hydrolase